jgi:hypothetical protein
MKSSWSGEQQQQQQQQQLALQGPSHEGAHTMCVGS